MDLNYFAPADYYHDVSMGAELDREIGEMLYRAMDAVDDAAKEAKFNIDYYPSEDYTKTQYNYLKTYLEKLEFNVEFLYKFGDIAEIAGVEISW